MSKKRGMIQVFILTIILTAVTLGLRFSPEQYPNYYANQFSQDMTMYGSVDLEFREDSTMKIVGGGDPQIIYSVPLEGDYLSSKVTFARTPEFPLHLHIYYADELSNFSEENTIDVTMNATADCIAFSLPDSDVAINYIRIDFDSTLDSVPAVDSVSLQSDTMFSRLASILLWMEDGHLLIMFAVSLILVCASVCFLQDRGKKDYQRDIAAVIIIAVSFFVIYYDYILGEKVFSFYDEVGSDSFIQRYSGLISTANRISNGLWSEYVDYTRGLGNRVLGFRMNIGNWFCIFGESGIARWLGIDYYLITLLAGIFAYYWGKLYTDSAKIGLMIAFGYAMSCEFTIRSAWFLYPHLAFVLIFWLMAFELWHRKGRWYLLPLATVVFFYDINSYFCVFWGFLCLVYILFRTVADSDGPIAWKKWLKGELLYVFFAVIGMLDRLIAELSDMLHSPRFTDAMSEYSVSFARILSDKAIIASAFLRTVGQTINGISEDFSGKWQFLSDPSFYCGILFFLLLPLSIYNLEKRKKWLYISIVVASVLYIAVIPIRIVANGFSGNDFRQSSFWICIFMLLIAMEALKRIFHESKLKKGSLEVFQCSVAVTITVLLFIGKAQYAVRIEALMLSVFFIMLYGIVMPYWAMKPERRNWITRSLCVIFVIETLAVSWDTINDRNAIKIDDIESGKYYNDDTVDAIDVIGVTDQEWYRLDKSYGSVGLCDSVAQGYYGVSSYIGGTEADPGNIAIYKALELTRTDYGYHCLMGTGGNIYASSLLGVKYYLSKSELVDWYGLEHLTKVGDIFIYKNKLALPMAYVYDRTIDLEEFDQLSVYDKSRNVLDACIVTSVNDKLGNTGPTKFDFSSISEYQIPYEKSGQFYNVDTGEGKVLIIRMNMTNSGYFQTFYSINKDGAISGESITYGEGEKVVEVCCDNLSSVCLSEDMCKDISTIEFYAVDAEQYYEELRDDVAKLQINALEIVEHDDVYNYIEGMVVCDNAGVLATSIPMRDEWKIIVDGEETEVFTVNTAFVGCHLEPGEHSVVIYFDGKNWLQGYIFTMIGLIASIVILMVGYIKDRKNKCTI